MSTRDKLWVVAWMAILAEAALLRFWHLELKPLHHDEGVNGLFLSRLFREGVYYYDPANYHGPTLYYFGLIASYIFGLNTIAIRVVPALAGLLTSALALALRRRIGDIGALAAAAFLAVSPGAVYFSRAFIHESLFVMLTLALVVSYLRYRDTRRRGFLFCTTTVAALLVATKETAVISLAVLAAATLLTSVYARKRLSVTSGAVGEKSILSPEPVSAEPKRAASVAAPAVLFLTINVLFFSSFFGNPNGVVDSVRTFGFWFQTGVTHHVYGWPTYLIWLFREETPILLLGFIGVLIAVVDRANRFAVFLALWTGGMILAYSLVPYKTPWLTLNLILPLALAAGYAINRISGDVPSAKRVQRFSMRRIVLSLTVAVAAAGFSLYKAVDLNFVRYDDDGNSYVYAQTLREINGLLLDIRQISERTGMGGDISITVTSPEYWPLPWYLRNFTKVGYDGKVESPDGTIVIGSAAQTPELDARLGERYSRGETYELRPGVMLVTYIDRLALD